VNVGWGMNWRNDPYVHNCSIYCVMGPGSRYGQSGPLSTPIPSVWSLKEVGVQNHLPLWGNKSLCSRLRLQLKTLSDGVNDRSSRRRINVDARPGVGALLTLALLLALV
jgi:hypothetical protein